MYVYWLVLPVFLKTDVPTHFALNRGSYMCRCDWKTEL